MKGCSRIDLIVLGQHGVYNNLRERKREVGCSRDITYYRMGKAMVMWLYTGMAHRPVIDNALFW